MELILGGAYQGKRTWALKYYTICEPVCDLAVSDLQSAAIYCHLEALTRKAAEQGKSAEHVLEQLLPLAAKAVIISREIGSGVVPMDPIERDWRELHGKVLQVLAEKSDKVYRIFCGLEEQLK